MAFSASEDLSCYLDDFGVTCKKGTTTFIGILDMPDTVYDLGGMSMQSTEYKLTYRSADASLSNGDALTVDGVAYVVRSPADKLDDGLFSAAKLSKP